MRELLVEAEKLLRSIVDGKAPPHLTNVDKALKMVMEARKLEEAQWQSKQSSSESIQA
jgi:hypothetical protein